MRCDNKKWNCHIWGRPCGCLAYPERKRRIQRGWGEPPRGGMAGVGEARHFVRIVKCVHYNSPKTIRAKVRPLFQRSPFQRGLYQPHKQGGGLVRPTLELWVELHANEEWVAGQFYGLH